MISPKLNEEVGVGEQVVGEEWGAEKDKWKGGEEGEWHFGTIGRLFVWSFGWGGGLFS